MPSMRAVQVSAPGGAFELVNKDIPTPGDHDILIRVEASGVCHGDAMVREGRYPGLQYPRIPGHEVVGVVAEAGQNAAEWQAGQRIGVGWYGGPCRKCRACQRGEFHRCESPLATGLSLDGGYAEYMLAPRQAVVRIPDELSPVEAAPLLCAGRTTFDALRTSGARGGDLVAVLGLGGLGHLAVQYAVKFGCKTIALSRGKDKEALAYQLGAHGYIDTDATNPGEALRALGGARAILSTAPSAKAVSAVIDGLGTDGQLFLIGMQNEPIMLSPFQLMRGGRSIHGSMGRPGENTIDDTLKFSVLANVRPQVETFPLAQAAEAFDKMMTARVHFRSVILPQQ
ncbi:MAG: alcohol dehydrogenase catalytic domain-containing protein [Anaerolineales bacterium]